MIADSEQYDVKIQEILNSLEKPVDKSKSFFVESPKIQLVTITREQRHWFFWKKEKRIKGIKLLSNMVYWSGTLRAYVIELEGVTSDGASVPQIFWSIFPPFGKDADSDYVNAAIGHDKLVRRGEKGISKYDFKKAAKLFKEMMIVLKVKRRIVIVMYNAVRWCGPKYDSAV